MGATIQKARRCLTDEQGYQNSYFYKQQTKQYSYELSDQCLKHLKSLNMSSFNSLKKIYCYLHPAVKLILSSKNKQEVREALIHYQNDLIHSSVNVVRMYLAFLERVVPTNITYFHFMREKDLYSHYISILYGLEFGHLNSSLQDGRHIYEKISDDDQRKMLKIFSHWLYDMVKYYGSAIYLKSETMPHLINALYTFVVGIVENEKKNFIADYSIDQRQQLYDHLLYLSTYILCQSNHQNNYSMLQVVCGCLTRLFSCMEMHSFDRVIYAASYWYVEEIGYINQPILQKICVAVLLDLLNVEKKKIIKKEKNMMKKKDKHNKSYNKFEDEEQQTSSNMFDAQPKPDEINKLSTIYIYNTLYTILKNSNQSHELPHLKNFLLSVTKKLHPESLSRSYILDIINIVYLPSSMKSVSRYYEQNQQDYQLNSKTIPWGVMRKNCSFYVNKLIPFNVKAFNVQLVKEQSEILTEILNYNIGQFIDD